MRLVKPAIHENGKVIELVDHHQMCRKSTGQGPPKGFPSNIGGAEQIALFAGFMEAQVGRLVINLHVKESKSNIQNSNEFRRFAT